MIFIVKLVNASQKISQKLANMFVFRTNKGALMWPMVCKLLSKVFSNFQICSFFVPERSADAARSPGACGGPQCAPPMARTKEDWAADGWGRRKIGKIQNWHNSS